MTLQFHPPVIGHRGACAYAPENTMASFIKAAQLGIKWVEFDVMQASSGEPVIFHDDLLDRTSNGRGELEECSYSYLRTLDAGSWFDPVYSSERIPELLTVIDFLQEAKISANVEIKTSSRNEEKLVQRVITELSPYLAKNNAGFLFSSFSMNALHLLRKYAPDCQLGILLHEWEPDWQTVCESLHCVSVHTNHEIMSAKSARMIKDMGKKLLCYTVNNPARARELFGWGVDAVFSDVPDLIY